MTTKKLAKYLVVDYIFVIFALSLRQRVHLQHETFRANSSIEKGWLPFETAWCFA